MQQKICGKLVVQYNRSYQSENHAVERAGERPSLTSQGAPEPTVHSFRNFGAGPPLGRRARALIR